MAKTTGPKTAESKEDKFVRLATARVNAILSKVQSLGALATGQGYNHEKRPERVKQMKRALMEAIEEALPDDLAKPVPKSFEFKEG